MFKTFFRGFADAFKFDEHELRLAGEFTGQLVIFAAVVCACIGLIALAIRLFS